MATSNPLLPSKPGARTCLCSPTNHPGSFRCSFHRKYRGKPSSFSPSSPARAGSGRVPPARSSAAGAATVAKESGSGLRVLLLQIIGPSRHNLCRRKNFQPKPTRFCPMSGSGQGVAVV